MQKQPIPTPLINKLIKKAQGLIQASSRMTHNLGQHKLINTSGFIVVESHSPKGLSTASTLSILNIQNDLLLRIQYLPYKILNCHGMDYGWMSRFLSINNASFVTPYMKEEKLPYVESNPLRSVSV